MFSNKSEQVVGFLRSQASTGNTGVGKAGTRGQVMLRGAFWWWRRCPAQSVLSRPPEPAHRLDGAPARGRLALWRPGRGAFDGWVGAPHTWPHVSSCSPPSRPQGRGAHPADPRCMERWPWKSRAEGPLSCSPSSRSRPRPVEESGDIRGIGLDLWPTARLRFGFIFSPSSSL